MPFSKEPKGIEIKKYPIKGYKHELEESEAEKKREGYAHE